MALDLNEVQRQLEANVKNISRLQANQYRNRCHDCNDPIPPQDIRCQDSEGRDLCLACGDGVKPDNDDPEVFSYA